MIART